MTAEAYGTLAGIDWLVPDELPNPAGTIATFPDVIDESDNGARVRLQAHTPRRPCDTCTSAQSYQSPRTAIGRALPAAAGLGGMSTRTQSPDAAVSPATTAIAAP